ncbi:type B 50S ribosomal protein L31 [Nannocystis pusilla]|uniref:type B 50S ribosomal protein L31 n=1 Tax=Nannocystis pusilla TaxID=889268 RepID=UPI003B7D091E
MKSGIHPSYRKVLFVDASSGDEWVSYSTMTGGDTRPHKGEDLPVVRVDISSFSHPFWTGQSREVDTEGRMDRFRRRYGVKGGASAAPAAAAAAKPAAAAAAPAPAKVEAAAPAKPAGKAKKK